MHYKNLPYIQTVNGAKKTYYYFRKDHNLPGIRLPNPNTSTRDTCLQAYYTAKNIKPSDLKGKFTMLYTVLEEFLEDAVAHVCQSSKVNYTAHANRIKQHFPDMPLGEISRLHVIDYLKQIENKNTSKNNQSFFKRFWKWAIYHHYIQEDIFADLRRAPSSENELAAIRKGRWTETMIKTFRKQWPTNTYERTAMEVLLNTGCRVSDAIHLTKANLDGDVLKYVAQKNKIQVSVKLKSKFFAHIQHVVTDNEPFLRHPKTHEEFTSYQSFYSFFKNATKTANVDGGIHGLRKAFATRLVESGVNQFGLIAACGWTNPYTAQIYVKEFERRKAGLEATASMKFE